MDLNAFLTQIKREFYPVVGGITSYPRDPYRYVKVLDTVPAMTSPNVMHILNCAVQNMGDGEIYLEVGAWRGGTFIGALLNTDRHGIAIDDDSMIGLDNNHIDDRRNSDVWRENVAAFGLTEQATFVNGRVPEVWEEPNLTNDQRIGVYFFDGDKTNVDTVIAGLAGVVPYLAPQALIVLDDANMPEIRIAAHAFMSAYHDRTITVLDFPSPSNTWIAGAWNGLRGIGWGVWLGGG